MAMGRGSDFYSLHCIFQILYQKKFFSFIYHLFGFTVSYFRQVGSSSLTRDGTWALCIGSLRYWTTSDVPKVFFVCLFA